MTPPRPLLLAAALVLAACDSGPVGEGGAVYRTDGADYPNAAARLADGSLAVGVLTEGVGAPADGTVGYPGVVRFSAAGALTDADVYRGGERAFSGVQGVAPFRGGVAAAQVSDGRASVYRKPARGGDLRLVFQTEAEAGLASDALVAVPGGLVLSVLPRTPTDPHLYALGDDGGVRWSYRLPGAQDARAVGPTPDGDVFVVGYGSGGGSVVARLGPDGAERWRRTSPDVARVAAVADDGLVVASDVAVAQGGGDGYAVEVRVVRLDGEGGAVWARTVAAAPTSEGALLPTALAALPGGAVALAFGQSRGFDRGRTARLLVLDADGSERASVALGGADRTTVVTHLLPAPGGGLTAVSAVGPQRLDGFGGDDFDVVVTQVEL